MAEEALQGFVACAKNAKGQAVCHWITEAVNHPNVYTFGELLDLPSVAALRDDGDNSKHYKLLKIFSSGTFLDYKRFQSELPNVEPKALNKLRQLTVVSMAAKERSLLYDELKQALEITDVRQLEDLLIEIITNGLIKAKLDQKNMRVDVQDAVARDVCDDDVSRMLATLTAWSQSASHVIASLNEIEKHANAAFSDRQTHRQENEAKAESLKLALKKEAIEKPDGGRHGHGMDEGGAAPMDEDYYPAEYGAQRSRGKKRGLEFPGMQGFFRRGGM